MSLRTQLVVAFFLLAVVPLLGVSVYAYRQSERSYKAVVNAEALALANDMSTRAESVVEELSMRIARMGERPVRPTESRFEKARRAEQQLRQLGYHPIWKTGA